MEGLVILLILGIGVCVFVLPIVASLRARRAIAEVEELRARLGYVENEISRLRRDTSQSQDPSATMESVDSGTEESSAPSSEWKSTQDLDEPAPEVNSPVLAAEPTAFVSQPPPLRQPITPPPMPPLVSSAEASSSGEDSVFRQVKGSLNWEQFMGAKLYAWIGGFALFLAVAYFVKYSFDRGWLPPEVRVSLGFLLGLGLVGGGVFVRRRDLTIMSHTLCATGVLILYGVTFACRAVYHFAFFGPGPTFALMSLITATAFVLAVRMEARVVVVLGMLGGFSTPLLLSTGQDSPVALFTYIALLDLGVIAVALRQRWSFLTPLAAVGTAIMEAGWALKFFESGRYFEGSRIFTPMVVLLGFNLLWLGAAKLARRTTDEEHHTSASAAGLLVAAFAFAFAFLRFPELASRPWLLLGFVFALDWIALGLARADRSLEAVHPAAGAVVFAYLSLWLNNAVTNSLLPPALVFTLAFALAHTLIPLAFRRLDGIEEPPFKGIVLFPPVALLVLLIPVFKISELTVFVWPVILLVDVLAVALAAITLSIAPVALMLVLTLVAAAGVLFRIPAELTGLPTLLVLIAVFAAFFALAGGWLLRRLPPAAAHEPEDQFPTRLVGQIPSLAVVFPFLLLLMIVAKLPLPNPSPVFGLALLLVGMLFGVTRMFGLPWLPVIGLACVAALEHCWYLRIFRPDAAPTVLAWFLVFGGVFLAFPFVMRTRFENVSGPWIASALSGPAQFYLVYRLVTEAWPNQMMGLLAAAFAVPSLLGLVLVLKWVGGAEKARQTRLALFGGTALFFITLIFPLQFSRQWITVSWAIEGAALCWLFHRVPHSGLRLTAVGLLIVSFVRLALNPAVLDYHPRSATPIWNWYLYTYATVAAAQFVAARLLAPPRDQVMGTNAPAVLNTLGTVLSFLLVNIQIADFFTEPGRATLTFQFSGNFARDMSYSIAWALFALGLLVAGILRGLKSARYAALALLGVTILKLFFHDLSNLDAPYRIGALVAVALVALAASYLYQRFVGNLAKPDEPSPVEPPRT